MKKDNTETKTAEEFFRAKYKEHFEIVGEVTLSKVSISVELGMMWAYEYHQYASQSDRVTDEQINHIVNLICIYSELSSPKSAEYIKELILSLSHMQYETKDKKEKKKQLIDISDEDLEEVELMHFNKEHFRNISSVKIWFNDAVKWGHLKSLSYQYLQSKNYELPKYY